MVFPEAYVDNCVRFVQLGVEIMGANRRVGERRHNEGADIRFDYVPTEEIEIEIILIRLSGLHRKRDGSKSLQHHSLKDEECEVSRIYTM